MNLWPDLKDTTELMPYEILRDQVDQFNQEFGSELAAEFAEFSVEWQLFITKNQGRFIRLPEIKQKSTRILGVNQVDAYPCTVTWEGGKTRARTEAEFIGLLAKILNHQKTRLMIADLLKKGAQHA